jgi:hypothetical protein
MGREIISENLRRGGRSPWGDTDEGVVSLGSELD